MLHSNLQMWLYPLQQILFILALRDSCPLHHTYLLLFIVTICIVLGIIVLYCIVLYFC